VWSAGAAVKDEAGHRIAKVGTIAVSKYRIMSQERCAIVESATRMSLLSVVIMFLSFAAGLFAIRELKILAEGDVERYQVVRAISLITMTIAPYFIPDPWNNAAVIAGLLGLVASFFLKPKDYL
jgi:hypothetical protein